MLTTFTKKAAAELRSRILGWGIGISEHIRTGVSDSVRGFLDQLDINKVRTGTLDSLAQQILAEFRPANTSAPVVLDEFIANGVLLRSGLFENKLYQDVDLLAFVKSHRNRPNKYDPSIREILSICRTYADRAIHDLMDLDRFSADSCQNEAITKVILQYQAGLKDLDPSVVDFALLEQQFLVQLETGKLDRFTSGLRSIFVDEYQDTNALQEAIYMAIARKIGHSITIVGDDDQSLYRFRGGTVELFSNIQQRMQSELEIDTPTVCFLSTNYRSSNEIVSFVNDYADLDPRYQPSRIPNKPRLLAHQEEPRLPILGLFRPNAQTLSNDLALMLNGFFNKKDINIFTDAGDINIKVAADGMPGDCAFLAFSVKEHSSWDRHGQQPRLPSLLRESLSQLDTPIKSFNPHGQPLHHVAEVQHLCGLMLECIDPNSGYQDSVNNLGVQVTETLDQWRRKARTFIISNPDPRIPNNLNDFVTSWRQKTPQIDRSWPDRVPLLDLCYQLSTWIPELHEEPEKQIFLEVVARAVTKSATLNRYSSRIVNNPSNLEGPSVLEAIRNIFTPIAIGDITIDDEILDDLPRDAINFLTIHQAKGLEFPIVIVDVAAHYKTNSQKHRPMRFPDEDSIDSTHIVENNTRPYGQLRDGAFRYWRDSAFDDLVRRYFVAFSRPQALLILVGLDAAQPGRRIMNVATGSIRSGECRWLGNGRPYQNILEFSL